MREREIAERLAPLFDGLGVWQPNTLLGVPLAKIAEALDVPVEPDELQLPERLELPFGTAHDSHGPSYTKSDRSDDRGLSVTACGREAGVAHTVEFCRALADALVAAYNSRSWWRPGFPPSPGRYFVKNQEDERFDATWRSDSTTVTGVSTSGMWLRDGMPLVSKVVGWQPLPE